MYGTKKEKSGIKIKLIHEHFESIVFMESSDSMMPFCWPQRLNSCREFESGQSHIVTFDRSISKKMLHQVTGHSGHQFMVDTANVYKINVTGVLTNCLNFYLEKIRQKHIPKKKEDTIS